MQRNADWRYVETLLDGWRCEAGAGQRSVTHSRVLRTYTSCVLARFASGVFSRIAYVLF